MSVPSNEEFEVLSEPEASESETANGGKPTINDSLTWKAILS
jgi:hypothetical protein